MLSRTLFNIIVFVGLNSYLWDMMWSEFFIWLKGRNCRVEKVPNINTYGVFNECDCICDSLGNVIVWAPDFMEDWDSGEIEFLMSVVENYLSGIIGDFRGLHCHSFPNRHPVTLEVLDWE